MLYGDKCKGHVASNLQAPSVDAAMRYVIRLPCFLGEGSDLDVGGSMGMCSRNYMVWCYQRHLS